MPSDGERAGEGVYRRIAILGPERLKVVVDRLALDDDREASGDLGGRGLDRDDALDRRRVLLDDSRAAVGVQVHDRDLPSARPDGDGPYEVLAGDLGDHGAGQQRREPVARVGVEFGQRDARRLVDAGRPGLQRCRGRTGLEAY